MGAGSSVYALTTINLLGALGRHGLRDSEGRNE
jgi:hypothetical protein